MTAKTSRKPANAPPKAGGKRPLHTAWKPGQSGNPAGKKPGTRNHATLLAQALLDAEAEGVARMIIAAALKGDLAAAKLVLERVVPPMRERPVSVQVPSDLSTAAAVSEAAGAVLRAACEGELLPSEAHTLASIVETRRRAIETEDLERRLAALEEKDA